MARSFECSHYFVAFHIAVLIAVLVEVLGGVTGRFFMAVAHAQETIPAGQSTAGNSLGLESSSVTIELAKDRARLMSGIYLATLDVMHDRYFHRDRSVLPARAMEDIFAEIGRQSKMEAKWIGVSLKPMSITHEPKTEFEKRASKELHHGKQDSEVVEDGFYRRATAVPLGSNCIGCHSGQLGEPPKTPSFAGLVISIPIVDSNAPSKPK